MKNIDRLKSKLEIFDEILSERRMHYTVYLFGAGLGIYHLHEDYIMSSDLDYMSQDEIDDEDLKMMLETLEISDMGGIMLVPELADIEIVDRVEYQYLTVLIPSIENFALSKLFSSRPKDYNDLENYPILDMCDVEKLKEMLEEYLPYFVFADNPNYNFNYLDDLLNKRGLA